MNNDVTYPRVVFMQINTTEKVVMYDVTGIIFDDINNRVYAKGKTKPNGTNKKIEMYNTRVIITEEDE